MGQLIGQTAKRRVFRCIGTFLKSRHGPHHHRARTVPVPDHVIQRCDSCQMVMVIRIRIRVLLRLALPEIRLVETDSCVYDVTAIAGAGRLMALLKTSSNAVGRNGSGRMAGDASYNSIQFDSIRDRIRIRFQLPAANWRRCKQPTCNVQLVAD